MKKAISLAIEEAENEGKIIKIGEFLYDASNSNVVIRRRNKPDIGLISDEEIAKNIELILIHKQNLSTKELAKETSRNFGFKSTSKKTANRINGVLDLMIANNRVKLEKDFVELKLCYMSDKLSSPDNLPNKPGVYIMRDVTDTIIYIGKAKNLKNRVKSYFREKLDRPKTQILMSHFDSLEYILTNSEKEALILEATLIKKHHPRYNVQLKDDKRYPYVKITNEKFKI